jgi:hypothetical protein
MLIKRILYLFLILLPLTYLNAKDFSNQYCSFVLPVGWSCVIEGAEYVCQSENKDRQKEAIIILAAKLRGDQDTLDEYKKYLDEKKSYQIPGGSKQISDPKYTKLINKNSWQWVDSLHLASEVPGFYTRYLATVKEDLGVAVTFSVSKDKYSDYQGIFDKVIETLKVFRQRKVDLSKFQKSKTDYADDVDFDEDDDDGLQKISSNQKNKSSKGSGSGTDIMMIIGILAALAVGFIIMKKRKG